VIRADWAYEEPYPELFVYWRGLAAQLGYTTEESADFFRGRQVWIDHGNGIVSRYVHLSSIDPLVQVGTRVTAGQIIARVGNSGSPGSLEGESEDAHLHLEIRIGTGYLGQYLRPIETRDWIRKILR
jgi:murein DD-endopeptidase MepM/ murein hydrolase activator NlpD